MIRNKKTKKEDVGQLRAAWGHFQSYLQERSVDRQVKSFALACGHLASGPSSKRTNKQFEEMKERMCR